MKTETNLHPHPVAFLDEYIFWLLLFAVPFVIQYIGTILVPVVAGWSWLSSLLAKLGVADHSRTWLYCVLYLLVYLSGGALFSFKKVSAAWFRVMVVLALYTLAVSVWLVSFEAVRLALLWGSGLTALGGFLLVELRRREIYYRIESDGVVVGRRSRFSHSEMFYRFQHISHMYLKTTWAERLFSCGTVILIPTSGMNLGYESIRSGLFHFFIGSERTRTLPRSIPVYSLFSIKNAEAVFQQIRWQAANAGWGGSLHAVL